MDQQQREKILTKLNRRMSPGKREQLIKRMQEEKDRELAVRNRKRFNLFVLLLCSHIGIAIAGYFWAYYHFIILVK